MLRPPVPPAFRRVSSIVVLGAVAALVTGLLSAGAAVAAPTTLVASPNGAGTACTTSVPCALTTAVAKSTSGGAVKLVGGDYGPVTLPGRPAADAFTANVTISPLTSSPVTLGATDVKQSHLTFTGVTFTGLVYLYPSASFSVLSSVVVDGSGVFLRSSDSMITDSTIQGGSSVDGVQISGGQRSSVLRTTIKNFDQGGSTGYHADCIQLFDTAQVTIRGNTLVNCYNSGIIFSGGQGMGVNQVLVESNFIGGCPAVSSVCANGNGLDLRDAGAKNITVANNTINGSTRVRALPGLVFDRNIVAYLSDCATPATNSIIVKWNTGLCAQPAALRSGQGNRTGTVPFADAAAGDLHVAGSAATVSLSPMFFGVAAGTGRVDHDGQRFAPTTAGADEPSRSVAPSQPVDPAPTVRITSPSAGTTVSGIVRVVVAASDDKGVRAVSVNAGPFSLPAVPQANGTWVVLIDTRSYPDGAAVLQARATDTVSQSTTSEVVVVRSAN